MEIAQASQSIPTVSSFELENGTTTQNESGTLNAGQGCFRSIRLAAVIGLSVTTLTALAAGIAAAVMDTGSDAQLVAGITAGVAGGAVALGGALAMKYA